MLGHHDDISGLNAQIKFTFITDLNGHHDVDAFIRTSLPPARLYCPLLIHSTVTTSYQVYRYLVNAIRPSTYAQYIRFSRLHKCGKARHTPLHPKFKIFKNKQEFSDMESFLRVKDFKYNFRHDIIKVLDH